MPRVSRGTRCELHRCYGAAFASRLPIQSILLAFGLPLDAEPKFQRWFDRFAAALANYSGAEGLRMSGKAAVAELHAFLREWIEELRRRPGPGLLSRLANAPVAERLSDEEICGNAGVVFFGGISTVEGLILNALWALFTHPTVLSQVLGDRAQFPRVLEETMRWLGPEQSAHRVVTRPTTLGGAELLPGDTVSCNLAA